MTLTYKEVAEIMKIIDASQCEEVVLEVEGARLVVRRGGTTGPDASMYNQSMPTPQPESVAKTGSGTPSTTAIDTSAMPPSGEAGVVTENSPMVGTFYRRPSPEKPPYVEVGSKVGVGDPLCMIEVMKLYTTISATVGGVIEAILPEDASLVEFDQPLFTIRPE